MANNIKQKQSKFTEKEKNILTLMNETLVKRFIEFATEYINYNKKEIEKISKKLIKEGYVEIIKLPRENDEIEEMYLHTIKVKPEMLNDDIRYKKDYGKSSIFNPKYK